MIEECGVVVEVQENEIAVRIDPETSCDACPVRENCYGNDRIVWVPRERGVRVADPVRLSIGGTSVLGLSALIYGVPLGALVMGIVGGYLFFFRSMAEDPRILLAMATGGAIFGLAAFVVSRIGGRLNGRIEYLLQRQQTGGGNSPPPDVPA